MTNNEDNNEDGKADDAHKDDAKDDATWPISQVSLRSPKNQPP